MKSTLDSLPVELDQGGVEVRAGRWGTMHVARFSLSPGTDLTPFFSILPDGLCSGEHWGVVMDGSITVRYRDGTQEVTRAGEAYYWPAGHTAWTDEGVVFVALTPLVQQEAMERQMAEAAAQP